jgi:hypothetical protein
VVRNASSAAGGGSGGATGVDVAIVAVDVRSGALLWQSPLVSGGEGEGRRGLAH